MCSIASAAATAPPVVLIITGPREQYKFTCDDLQAWPDSLLSRAVVDTSDEPAVDSRPAPVVWQLQNMPKSPLTAWPAALAVAHSLYRHRYITPDIMTTVLQGAAGRAAKHYEQYYQQLRELLSYLNLPGPVSRWLPPISLVRISHFNVLTFLSNYKELEYDYKVKMLAEHAVQQMLSYQPFVGETPPNSTDCISGVVANHARFTPRSTAFAIAYDASRGVDGPLRVYAVNDARNQLATRYDHWLEGVKAGSYGKDDSIIWDGERERSSSGARVKDLHFVELTPGVSAPLSIAEVGVQRFVGCVDTRPDVVLVGPTSDPPGTPETLAGHIRAMFGRLAESAALMLVNYTISINPTMKQLMDRLSFDRYEIRLWAICW